MNKKIIAGLVATLFIILVVCCSIVAVTPKRVIDPTVTIVFTPRALNTQTATNTMTIQPTQTLTDEPTAIEPTVTLVIVATDIPELTNTIAPTKQAVIRATVRPVIIHRPTATPYIPTNEIVCKDGFIWPSPVRKGACHGHGGIKK